MGSGLDKRTMERGNTVCSRGCEPPFEIISPGEISETVERHSLWTIKSAIERGTEMKTGLEMRPAALHANAACSCITLDQEMLIKMLDANVGTEGFGTGLLASHPYLFANSPVFLAYETLAAMKAVFQAIESAIALPSFRAAALQWAPPIASADFGPAGALMGYDFHLTESGPLLIEINTNAGGAFLNAILAKAQRACCFGEDLTIELARPKQDFDLEIVAMFEREWKRQGRSGRPAVVAIVDDEPEEQHLYPELLLAKAALEKQGIAAIIADPKMLVGSDDGLSISGFHIDLVYNRLVDFTLDDPGHGALRDEYLRGKVVVTPNPHVHAMFADKRNLALLSDASLLAEAGLAADEVEIVKSAVPKTVLVTGDNADALWADRRNLFFKPARGYGSKATYRGAKLTHKVWTQIIAADYIAQTYAPPSLRRVERDGKMLELKVDIRLYTYYGAVLLTAARLYQGQTTNMRTPRGGFAPVLETPN